MFHLLVRTEKIMQTLFCYNFPAFSNLVLFNIYIFRKFESNISKGREAMAPRLYQSEATRNLMNLRIILLKFSENVYVEKH